MREQIEALIRNYSALVARIELARDIMLDAGVSSSAAIYQQEINIYESVIADLNGILG